MSYPWMPVGYGDDTWAAVNLITGDSGRRRPDAQQAIWDCNRFAERERWMNREHHLWLLAQEHRNELQQSLTPTASGAVFA